MSGREIPYSPMGKTKRVSHERMQEILAKHGGAVSSGKAEIPKSPISNAPKSPRLKWVAARLKDGTKSSHTIEASGYSVLRCTANDVPTGRYLAFGPRSRCLGGHNSGNEARDACQRDFDSRVET